MRTESDVRRNTQSVLIGTRSPGQVAEPSTSQTGDAPVIGAVRVGNRSCVGLDSHTIRRGSWDASGLSKNSPRTHRPRTHNPRMIAGIFMLCPSPFRMTIRLLTPPASAAGGRRMVMRNGDGHSMKMPAIILGL